MKKICLLAALFSFSYIGIANAQFAAQRDAARMIIVKVVADFRMEDAEFIRDFESLRENERFNRRLQNMLGNLSNARNKDTRNRRVNEILIKAGEDIDRVLRVL